MHRTQKKPFSAQILPLIGVLMSGSLAAGEPAATEQAAPLPTRPDYGCGESGSLKTALYGSLQTTVDWPGSEMICDSMQRPDGAGIRLRFAGDIAGERLAFIIAIPDMQRGEPAAELPSNVTATVEGSGRFFSTPNLDSCWTDVYSQTALSGDNDSFAISGTLYCVAPLGEVNGDAAVSIQELSFTTVVKWEEK